MKSITSFLFVPACMLTLMTGITAREFDRGDRSDRGNRAQRPNIHPQQHSNRNPITHSKIDAPSRRPQARPELNQIQRPSQRPAPQIQRPTTRPAPQIQQRPETRPNIANRPAPGTWNRP
jgi:hypothetical protein